MGLLEELKQQRAESLQRLEDHQKVAFEWQQNADIEQARIADLDRAIAALTPSPVEAEPGIPDALAQFMKREGAVEWKGGECPVEWNVTVEAVLGGGEIETRQADDFRWSHEPGFEEFDIKAYRIISEPAAGDDPERLDGGHGMPASATFEDYPDFTPEQTAAIESATAEFQSTDGAEIVSGEPFPQDADVEFETSDYFPTQPFTIGASKPHADESDAQMFAAGINRELEKA